jgi:hypothetical protein
VSLFCICVYQYSVPSGTMEHAQKFNKKIDSFKRFLKCFDPVYFNS